jgi:hypothetical protein
LKIMQSGCHNEGHARKRIHEHYVLSTKSVEQYDVGIFNLQFFMRL